MYKRAVALVLGIPVICPEAGLMLLYSYPQVAKPEVDLLRESIF